jgi:hypothetical protein
MLSLPTDYPSVITVENSDGFSPSVMYPSVRPSVDFFLFATKLATKRGFTDDFYTDGRVSSVSSSVIISPTEFIPFTDGISPSVKLFNGVVNGVFYLSLIFEHACTV